MVGLVALHNTGGAFGGDKDFVNLIGGEFDDMEAEYLKQE